MQEKPTEQEDKNNKEYAEGYSRGRSGDVFRDTAEYIFKDSDDDINHKGYEQGARDRKEYGYKSKDDCGDGETKSSGSCFLSTACVEYMGLKDDCNELKTLREFRDTYMQETTERKAMVKEYYSNAPQIVKKINALKTKDQIYHNIYENIIEIIKMIKFGSKEKAMKIYEKMYWELKNNSCFF
jgi:hypothetical protein